MHTKVYAQNALAQLTQKHARRVHDSEDARSGLIRIAK